MLSLTTFGVKADPAGYRWREAEGAMRSALKRQHTTMNRSLGRERRPVGKAVSINGQELQLGVLNGHLGYFVRRLQVAIFKDIIRAFAPMKLRPAQYSVLVLVEANPGRSQATIGRALNIERARLARLLHELERRRWIQRRIAPSDGRSHSLFLTSDGERALARIKALAARHEAQMAEAVGHKRRMLLMDLLRDFG
jgi:DNA-binding MarR family transcriptional regulator